MFVLKDEGLDLTEKDTDYTFSKLTCADKNFSILNALMLLFEHARLLWIRRKCNTVSRAVLYSQQMAKCEPCERNYDNMVKMLEDLNRDLEKLLEDMEKLSVQATWMAYDMVVMRANPDLANSMRRLEDAFLTCKEEMEKNWQEMLKETKGAEQKQE
ncbi:synaptonemal complex central element protein 3-like isoform X3 [Podarcis muralis]